MAKKSKLPMAALGGMGGSVGGDTPPQLDPAAGMMAPPPAPAAAPAAFSPSSLAKPRKATVKKPSGSSSKGTHSKPPMKGAAY